MDAASTLALRPSELGRTFCYWHRTKAPLNPRTGGNALTTDPATWGTKARAEAQVARLGGENPRGTGIMLAPLAAHPGWRLAGIDADSCIDPITSDLKWWARDIVGRLATYAEPSPSGAGLRVLLAVHDDDVAALRFAGLLTRDLVGTPKAGAIFALVGKHHELAFHVERRFLSLTERPFPGRDLIRPVGLDALTWLLSEHAPAVQASEGAGGRGADMIWSEGRGRDPSGSGAAFRFLLATFTAGATEEAAAEAIAEDQDDPGDWWGRTDERQQERALERARKLAERRTEARRGAVFATFDDEAPPAGEPPEPAKRDPLEEVLGSVDEFLGLTDLPEPEPASTGARGEVTAPPPPSARSTERQAADAHWATCA